VSAVFEEPLAYGVSGVLNSRLSMMAIFRIIVAVAGAVIAKDSVHE
jgi:hypothetical protein